ncbi:MAG: glucosamine-6-phosphate deaminase [Clostridia bacterium]|nr:glucosamine-6-phosphate deaminase [Clostridia bacterium]
MKIIICDNYSELSKKAAEIVAQQIQTKPNCILGLATGSTPIGLYDELTAMNQSGEIDFKDVISFNLDEYYPIAADNDQSYRYFMQKNLFSRININTSNTFIPNGEAADPVAECREYEKKIAEKGGIDLQILGIGQNGHIGFNEPDANLNSDTHLTELTQSTIEANSRFFENADEVPTHALTMGISSILKSKKIILLANGPKKRKVVASLLDSGINTNIPATMLKVHPDVTLICDREAYPGMHLGIDIGGTDVKFGVLDLDNNLVYTETISTPKASTDKNIMKAISDKSKMIIEKFPIAGIGVGTPGLIDKKRGLVSASNLPFDKSPIVDYLRQNIGIDIPVCLENDACCAAMGEAHLGVRAKNMLMVTLGTGIGGGIVIGGEIYSGSMGNAGEIGHICIDHDGIACACGHNGCWEAYASVTALINQTKKACEENPDSILNKLIKDEGAVTGKTVFDAMDKGCPVAQKVFDKYTTYLAIGIRNVIVAFDPDTIVIGGGISKEGERLLNPIIEKVKSDTPIRISILQGNAGAIGAAMLSKLKNTVK